ncbi:MAG: hypothetical protein ILO53_01895 [Clostridia bacterium]|nr:hypothetical protein [Clostridia bacterium]
MKFFHSHKTGLWVAARLVAAVLAAVLALALFPGCKKQAAPGGATALPSDSGTGTPSSDVIPGETGKPANDAAPDATEGAENSESATDGAENATENPTGNTENATGNTPDPTCKPDTPRTPPAGEAKQTHNAANDTFDYIRSVAYTTEEGIFVSIFDYTWLSWFGLAREDVDAEKALCEAAGEPFTVKVKATQFSTVKLTEAELEDQVNYKAADGTDVERDGLYSYTLALFCPSEITFGTRTVSAPFGRYKIQPFDGTTPLSERALADGGFKELVEESRTDEEVVYHYEYHTLVYSLPTR